MLYFFTDIEIQISIVLLIALFFTLIYEFINGFHDTANSITTVIYTCALQHHIAVIISGIFNFLGVILSGLSVAYTIIHILPNNFLINNDPIHATLMIFSMLLAAIIWNLSTWYLGLPSSSSHTLIGAIIGIGIINAIINHSSITETLNISKLTKIIASLILSPLIGLILSIIIIFTIYLYTNENDKQYIHLTPTEKEKKHGKRQPSLWPRMILILSAAGVSFSHGANDGQKGIGLIMLILIGIAPANFVVNMNATAYDIKRTKIAIINLHEYYIKNLIMINKFIETNNQSTDFVCNIYQTQKYLDIQLSNNNIYINNTYKINNNYYVNNTITNTKLKNIFIISTNFKKAILLLDNINNYNQLYAEQRSNIRYILIYLADFADKIAKIPDISKTDKKLLYKLQHNLLITVEYAPMWIILGVALSLSLGTIIGWKRITITIGEKIGKKEMTYAQGISAQITTVISTSIASYTGMPVSTTHVLSSAVTGTMLVNGNGIQNETIKNILLTWALTVPSTIMLTCILYWLSLTLISYFL